MQGRRCSPRANRIPGPLVTLGKIGQNWGTQYLDIYASAVFVLSVSEIVRCTTILTWTMRAEAARQIETCCLRDGPTLAGDGVIQIDGWDICRPPQFVAWSCGTQYCDAVLWVVVECQTGKQLMLGTNIIVAVGQLV